MAWPGCTAIPPVPLAPPRRRRGIRPPAVTWFCWRWPRPRARTPIPARPCRNSPTRFRALSAGTRITAYDPDRRAERQAFVRSLGRLTELGILIRRTSDETLLRQWEEEGTGVGAGYELDRDALLQFTDPYTVELALAAGQPDVRDSGDDEASRLHTRGQRLLRILVEDTALLYADLHPLDADYARAQRSWLTGQAADMTGGVVEVRAEGMLLRLPDDRPTSSAVTPMFPAATAGRWFALKVLDAATGGGVRQRRPR